MTAVDCIVVFSTCGDKSEVGIIATRLVTDRAAACVSIVDSITSVYQWQGKIERGTECLLIIKTRAALAGQVETIIKGLSSYDCPEVVVLPVAGGAQEYFRWISSVTAQ